MRKLFVVIAALVGISAFAIGCLGFLALRYYDAYRGAYTELGRYRAIVGGSAMAYGTLHSYDPQTKTLEIERSNPYSSTGGSLVLRFGLQERAFIGQQELTTNDGRAYLASTTPSSETALAALPAGTRVKFFTVTNSSGGLDVMYLVYGNPL